MATNLSFRTKSRHYSPIFLIWANAAFLLGVLVIAIFFQGLSASYAEAKKLSATFSWGGRGSNKISAQLTNSGYTGKRPARVEYGVYWCTKAGNQACAPDLSGEQKSQETLAFQQLDLAIPSTSSRIQLPDVSGLIGKTCGRFQVDLGFPDRGGIIGGQVFVIGGDCSTTTTPPVVEECPYASTQARVQKNDQDPWKSQISVNLGERVQFGGFHNGTGRFAGDPANSYSPNKADVDIQVIEPNGGAITNLGNRYPIIFAPTKSGTYAFSARTRKDADKPNSGYYSEAACKDGGTVKVSVKQSPTPSPKVTPSPKSSPKATPTPTPSPSATTAKNKMPECVSLSASPTQGGANLSVNFIGKARDRDGIIRRMEFDFGDGNTQGQDISSSGTNQDTVVALSHTYTASGTYTASVRAKDNSGQGNEWSSTPESCKIKIKVEGEVLGSSGASVLPKAGVSELFTLGYVISGLGGVSLKLLANIARNIS